MKEFIYKIKDPVGIHARPAGLIVNEASKFNSEITIYLNDKAADAKKLFSVMKLAAKKGDEIKISVKGNDEEKAENNFKKFLCENL